MSQMSDLFLLQLDDLWTEGGCFDSPKEGDRGAPTPRSPILRKSAHADLRIGPEQTEKSEVPRESKL
jgi:hypothetical protein